MYISTRCIPLSFSEFSHSCVGFPPSSQSEPVPRSLSIHAWLNSEKACLLCGPNRTDEFWTEPLSSGLILVLRVGGLHCKTCQFEWIMIQVELKPAATIWRDLDCNHMDKICCGFLFLHKVGKRVIIYSV